MRMPATAAIVCASGGAATPRLGASGMFVPVDVPSLPPLS